MTMVLLAPNFSVVGRFQGYASRDELLSQQGMFAADYDFALRHSDDLARSMLESIPDWYHDESVRQGKELNIDIRVHSLLEGQYPATPGWHVDAAVRETSFDDAAVKEPVSHSLVGTISDSKFGVSNTVFCEDSLSFDDTYENLVTRNCKKLQEGMPRGVEEWVSSDGVWTLFDPCTVHRVAAANVDGTRLFARVSLWSPPVGHVPGLTKVEQVYELGKVEEDFLK